jgi:membrane-bound lytic murein transglycosylase A
MIHQRLITKDSASSNHIKQYLQTHPDKMDSILNQNKSFVFFEVLKNNSANGAQGVPLTPGYSLAVDHSWVPYGTPTWLVTKITKKDKGTQAFQRLLVAQDTGGAIIGAVRGDVFWGAGKNETFIANHMHNSGRYWLLLPRHIISRI